jgi:uncharacterized protein (TIGR00661 family)
LGVLVKILYGVVGEGMGHATRSAVVLSHLIDTGHEVRVVVSGKAHDFLKDRFSEKKSITVEEIDGLTLRYFGNRLDRAGSLFWNLRSAPKAIRKNIKVYRKVAEEGFRPELVISDFESFAALYALRHGIPVVSIDNMQIINRCKHPKAIKKGKGFDFRLVRLAVKAKVPNAYHYLISTFFYPPVRRKFTTLVPPILRDEVRSAKREPRDHIVVYQRAVGEKALVKMLKTLPFPFRVYGAESDGEDENVTLRRFSGEGFLEDLRTARAVVAGGGFSLMSEAVSLRVPMLSIPIEHQYEQELNARYLQHLNYGRWSCKLTAGVIEGFMRETDACVEALQGYEPQDNSRLFACLDELVDYVSKGRKRPKRLAAGAAA